MARDPGAGPRVAGGAEVGAGRIPPARQGELDEGTQQKIRPRLPTRLHCLMKLKKKHKKNTQKNTTPHFIYSASAPEAPAMSPFSIPVVQSPARPAPPSRAPCCSAPPRPRPPEDCSQAPGFLSYHSVCFQGVTVQINSIIQISNKDFSSNQDNSFSFGRPQGPGVEHGGTCQGRPRIRSLSQGLAHLLPGRPFWARDSRAPILWLLPPP